MSIQAVSMTHTLLSITKKLFSILSCNCEPFTSELLENLEELAVWYSWSSFQWSISDYFSQHTETITSELSAEASDRPEVNRSSDRVTQAPLPPFDALWMCVYSRLGSLCVDTRPAVRKSAGQTLFTTIAAHGALLQAATWQTVLWQVLPLFREIIEYYLYFQILHLENHTIPLN